MFKRFSLKKKARPDLRFVDPEEYRSLREPLKHKSLVLTKSPKQGINFGGSGISEYSDLISSPSKNPTRKQSFYRDLKGAPLYVNENIDESVDEIISINSDVDDLTPSFLERSLDNKEQDPCKDDLFDLFIGEYGETTDDLEFEDKVKVKLEEHMAAKASLSNQSQFTSGFVGPNYLCKNSLGIFSDSKAYSALIKKELSSYQLDVRHFNHPNTFVANRFEFFDRISAWIIFLSDDCDEQFIDQFLDRYCDKPTLFLCPKASRTRTAERINEFIQTCSLEEEADISEDPIEMT